jgi:NAD(P)-dependent dehydrogenase (short-subunit alcohol dehydrogenase family)
MNTTRTILITGATTGIGRHAALYLARAGHRVFATGRNIAALAALQTEAAGLSLQVVSLDVTDRASLAEAVAEVARLTGGRGVDALVNNAGYGEMAPLLEIREADVRAMYETNVFGLLAVTQAFLPAMVARGAGRIVNLSSVGGRLTFPLFGAYNSTKYAVESLSDAMRMELGPLGIQVVIIEPGAIKTEFSNTSVRKIDSYRGADSPYAAIYARIDEIKAQISRTAVDPLVISKAIERAVTARTPRARYVAPVVGRVIIALAAWLPTRAFDWVVAQAMGLTGADYGAATPRAAPLGK